MPDTNAGTVFSNTNLVVQFCAPVADNINAVQIYSNGTNIFFGGFTRITPEASQSGLAQYQSQVFGQLSRGTYSIQVGTFNTSESGVVQAGPLSDPFTLSVVDVVVIPPPAAPKIKTVRQP